MANLKMNLKTDFLYFEDNYIQKVLDVLNEYVGQRILFVCDTESQKLLIQNLRGANIEAVFYKIETNQSSGIDDVNDTMYQFASKNDISSHMEGVSLIIAAGCDDYINIGKQISAVFNIPYIVILNCLNSSLCASKFYALNFEIKSANVPLGIIVDLKDSTELIWSQKILVEKAKLYTLKCGAFFDELFVGKHKYFLQENLTEFNIDNLKNISVKQSAESFYDLVLMQQFEMEYFSLFLLVEIYKNISKKRSLNNEYLLYKTLIKIYEIFSSNFLTKYKCFKCYDTVLNNENLELANSSYIKYVLCNFKTNIENCLDEFYEKMLCVEDKLNELSFIKMYQDKTSMSSTEVLKAFKIFVKIQKSPSFLQIIDFYNLF